MTRVLSLALVLILAIGMVACGSDDEPDEVTVDSADSCEELADATIPVMQELLDTVSEMTLEDMMAEEEPEILGDFEDQMNTIGEKSTELNCDDDEMESMLMERVDELTAEGPVGEMLLEVIQEGNFE